MNTKKQADQQNKQEIVSKEDFDKLQVEFNNLQDLAQKLENQLKRAVADYQNLEKRIAEGRSELSNWATIELIKRILPSLEHFDKVMTLGRPVLSERSESKDSHWRLTFQLLLTSPN